MVDQKYIDYLQKYEFKHPIEYRKHRSLTSIVQEDLEINDDASNNILNHIYNQNDEKKSRYNLLINKWSSFYSLDEKYLKDSQRVLKKYKFHENNMDDFIEDYVDFKRQQNFLSKYQYVQFRRFQYLNKIVPFLQVLALYNFCSPLFSLLAPIFGMIIPYATTITRSNSSFLKYSYSDRLFFNLIKKSAYCLVVKKYLPLFQ